MTSSIHSQIASGEKDLGLIFDVKKFSVNDGPGIRTTVFFKGCPLRCLWCHNPESFESFPQVVFDEKRCISNQHACTLSCPRHAISRNGSFSFAGERCDGCGLCADTCPADAIRVIGRYVTPADLLAEIRRDSIFFDRSGGGVTFSGGEPLLQAPFLREVLDLCRRQRIHTAVDTCGHVPPEMLESILERVDLFLFDCKLIDDRRHRAHTGVSSQLILGNLKRIAAAGRPLIIRIPLIPGYTADAENIRSIVDWLTCLPTPPPVSLLSFHRGGEQKYRRLGYPYALKDVPALADDEVQSIKEIFTDRGFQVTLGE